MSDIKYPKTSTVSVRDEVDFVYVIRMDRDFAITPIIQRLEVEYQIGQQIIARTLRDEYDTFFINAISIIKDSLSSKGRVEIHIYDPEALSKAAQAKVGDALTLSLDPLVYDCCNLRISRSYYSGGKRDAGLVTRPGAPALDTQLQGIKVSLGNSEVVVLEDDICSGKSIATSLAMLSDQGIVVKKVVPNIQIGRSLRTVASATSIEPVITYVAHGNRNVFNRVDLGDVRDFLAGASGLVVKIANGSYGRLPYFMPFVSPAARASIPFEAECSFSLAMLKNNLHFFQKVEKALGYPVLLRHMHPAFLNIMNKVYSINQDTSMIKIIEWAMSDRAEIWETTLGHGRIQQGLDELNLSQKIIFVDVNGTLFPDDSPDGFIPIEDLRHLERTINDVQAGGVSVGLCSDSPLPQLRQLAERLNMNGPIIAENGNILYHDNKTIVINSFSHLEAFKERIRTYAKQSGYVKLPDVIAPEFGGDFSLQENTWAFGADRQASITIFAPPAFIKLLNASFADQPGISIDCSPEYNFLAIQPVKDFASAKGETLMTLAKYGYNVIMIGNSMSDWVSHSERIACAFVANPRISTEVRQSGVYISTKPFAQGVADIIAKYDLLSQ